MRSGELARLAGVTVRTLRHYEQVGVLDEPVRDTNGYRSYDVHDLVRVLRIRRLAALGVALEQMPGVLDDGNGSAEASTLLDDLDRELAAQIDRLTTQRALVARLREHGGAPDLPPELAPYLALFATAGLPQDLARADRDQAVLLAHLAGDGAIEYLTRFYRRLSDPELIASVSDVVARFGRLGPHSTDRDATELVELFVHAVGPAIAELAGSAPLTELDAHADLLSEHTVDMLNAEQRAVLDQVQARLTAPLDPPRRERQRSPESG